MNTVFSTKFQSFFIVLEDYKILTVGAFEINEENRQMCSLHFTWTIMPHAFYFYVLYGRISRNA